MSLVLGVCLGVCGEEQHQINQQPAKAKPIVGGGAGAEKWSLGVGSFFLGRAFNIKYIFLCGRFWPFFLTPSCHIAGLHFRDDRETAKKRKKQTEKLGKAMAGRQAKQKNKKTKKMRKKKKNKSCHVCVILSASVVCERRTLFFYFHSPSLCSVLCVLCCLALKLLAYEPQNAALPNKSILFMQNEHAKGFWSASLPVRHSVSPPTRRSLARFSNFPIVSFVCLN